MRWRTPAVAILVLLTAGWMTFDGIHALVVGDFVTPKSGEYAGQLGPWAAIPRAVGIDPRADGVKVSFVAFGLVYLAALGADLAGLRRGRAAVATCAAIALLYLPFGTLASLGVLVLLGRRRGSDRTPGSDPRKLSS
jgi:hypothetical protein